MKNGGPAFPVIGIYLNDDKEVGQSGEGGMMLRDYFAAHAPAPPSYWHDSDLFKWRWHYADRMLAERDK